MINFIKNIVVFSFGIFISVVFFEIYFKVTEIKLPFKTIDSHDGKGYIKNALIHENKENLYLGNTNTFGFVGNYGLKKPSNTYRIAFFGDSFVEGFQLFEKYQFVNILESELNKKSNIKVEVLNFSVSNSVLSDVYIRKKRLAEKFDIDLYVYFFDNYDLILPSQSPISNTEIQITQNKLQIVNPNTKSYSYYKKLKPLFDNSATINLALDGYFLYHRKELIPILLDKLYIKDKNKNKVDYKYYDTYFKNLPEVSKRVITEFNNENSILIFRDSLNSNLKASIHRTPKFKTPIIDTKPLFDSLKKEKIKPYYWKNTNSVGHFNYEANDVLGKYLAKKIKPYVKK